MMPNGDVAVIWQALGRVEQSIARIERQHADRHDQIMQQLRELQMGQADINTQVQNLTAVAQTLSSNDTALTTAVGQLQSLISSNQGGSVDTSELDAVVSQLQTAVSSNSDALGQIQALVPAAPAGGTTPAS
jgi:chromosome segregation ATPase